MILHRVGREASAGSSVKIRNQPTSLRRTQQLLQHDSLSEREQRADHLLCWIRSIIARTSPLADRFSPNALLRLRNSNPSSGVPASITDVGPRYTWGEIDQIIGRAPSPRNRMALGVLLFMTNRYLESANISLAIAREASDVALRAKALANAAESLSLLSEHDLAWQCAIEAVALMPERPATYVTALSTAVLSRQPSLLSCAKGLILNVEDGASIELQNAAQHRRRRVGVHEVRKRVNWTSCVTEVERTCPEMIDAQYV